MAERRLTPKNLDEKRYQKIVSHEMRGASEKRKEFVEKAIRLGVENKIKKERRQFGLLEKSVDEKVTGFAFSKKNKDRQEFKKVLYREKDRAAIEHIVDKFYGHKPEVAKPKEEVQKEAPKKFVPLVRQEPKHETETHRFPYYTPPPPADHSFPPIEHHEPFHNPLSSIPPTPPPPANDTSFPHDQAA